jgi:hypothetical protein
MEFLIETGKSILVSAIVVIAVTFVVTLAWALGARLLAPWDKPLKLTQDGGAIRPWPPVWWAMTIIMGLVVVGGGGSAFYIGNAAGTMIMLAVDAGLSVIVWLCLLMSLPHAVLAWTDHGVEGPASSFSLGRHEMTWANIARVHRSESGNYFEDLSGQRIVWSDMYVGSRYLWDFLLHKRPDLRPLVIGAATENA